MTAVADEVQAPAEAEAEAEAEAGVQVTGRALLIAEVTRVIEAHAARMILARQITTGYNRNYDTGLCNDGVQSFMVRGRLRPPGNSVQIQREPEDIRLKNEALLRADCWKLFGTGPDSLEDYTVAGISRRLEQSVAAHENWAKEFRALIITHVRSGQINPRKRDEAFRDLHFPEYQQERRMSVSFRGNWIHVAGGTTRADQAAGYTDRFVQALQKEFGEELGNEEQLRAFLSITAQDI